MLDFSRGRGEGIEINKRVFNIEKEQLLSIRVAIHKIQGTRHRSE